MSDYTPTTEQVRSAYWHGTVDRDVVGRGTEARDRFDSEFDRWLAAHDAEVRAEVISNMDKWIDASIDARRKTPREDAE